MTTQKSKVVTLIALCSTLGFLLLYLIPNQSNADESLPSPAMPMDLLATVTPVLLSTSATKDAEPLVSPTEQVILSTNPVVVSRVLVATPTAVAATGLSPLPTIAMAESAALTTTLVLQSRVALSVATVAQALWESLQKPVVALPLGGDVTSPTLTPVPITLTITSGELPPLVIPTVDLVPQEESADRSPVNNVTVPLQADGAVRVAHVPVLMYHYLSEVPADADIYRRDLSVPPALFAAHLDRIQAEGYTVIRLYDLVANLLQGTPLPDKAVVITFDDGYRDNYDNAFPILREHGMTATFFVVMEFINRERPEYLTWPMVQEMAAGGMSIEAHGVDHTSLRNRSEADLEFQALRSYETLQNAVGARARFISYPAGEFDDQTIAAFQRAGYWAGFTTVQGATHRSDDLFRLPRVRVRGTTTPDELARLLALDW
ncbi:MAG TPA: polysaccharide deacetylase family protein [Caldilineaceae bacterium]|nr:polysaccharide deacetylase family protein [Caldilineaceae bacterium]